jgi:hypothetical protein
MKKENTVIWIAAFLFAVGAYWLTAVVNRPFLLWAEENSLFLTTRDFFIRQLQSAGGLLSWCGAFLTQFLHIPALGASVFIALLAVVSWLTWKAGNFPKSMFILAFLPAAILLYSWMMVGDTLYSLKSPGYLYSNTLGVIVSLCGFLLYRKIGAAPLLLALFIVLTYPLFGFYTLFSALLCLLWEAKIYLQNRNRRHLICIATAAVLIGIVPCLTVKYWFVQMESCRSYWAGLPLFYFPREWDLWLPLIVLFLSLATLVCLQIKGQKPFLTFGSLAGVALLLGGVWYASDKQTDFRYVLQLNQAIEHNDWARIIRMDKHHPQAPVRLAVLARNLALYKMGNGGDQLFTLNNQSVLPKFKRMELVMIRFGARPLYFNYGKINYCYRWCMEDMVEYGMNVSQLQYMVKCALINGEPALAQKYNDLLKQTLFHRKDANKMQHYIEHPEEYTQLPEIKNITTLMAYNNRIDSDNNQLEMFLLNDFAFMENGTPEMLDLSLQCNLILRNIDRFWPRFFYYLNTHPNRIPVHYQEAALLYAYLEQKVDISQIKFDPQVVDQFNRFQAFTQRNINNSDDLNRRLFKPQFGKTFWYYYFFVNDIQTM